MIYLYIFFVEVIFMDPKKVILNCFLELFFMLVAVGLLMDDLRFVGTVVLLAVLGHSSYSLFNMIREGRKNGKS